jgi:hypothetical protein
MRQSPATETPLIRRRSIAKRPRSATQAAGVDPLVDTDFRFQTAAGPL